MPNKHTWFNVAAAEAQAAEVSIRGYIGEWGVTDRDFIASVDALGDVDEINVRINSRGGEMDHALSIFNYLKTHKARVNVRVDGVAMSSGSIIAMAGDEIVMPANAIMMVHNPWTYISGNAKQLRKEADNLETFEQALVATYTARTGKSEDEIKSLLDDDTYMTAAEAVEMGFADRVESIGKRTSAMAFASALGIPADVLAKVRAAEEGGDSEEGEEPAAGNGDPAGEAAEGHTDLAEHVPGSLAAGIMAAAKELGIEAYAADIALDDGIQDPASAIEALRVAREIHDLCALAKRPEMAAAMIRRRVSLADARRALANARAQEDEALHTDSHIPASSSKPPKAEPRAVSTSSIWTARQNAKRQ